MGYLEVKEPGRLAARAYDDVYGSVYCGWSPDALELNSTGKPQLVSLSTCAVGDGGLDTVHEVCWFPRGGKSGIILYSSAFPGPRYHPVELYRPADLNVQQPGFEVIDAALALGDATLAAQVIEASFAMLARERDLVSGSTGKPIPAREFYRNIRVRLQAYRLGLRVDAADFEALAAELERELALPLPYPCASCGALAARLPLYRQLHELRGQQARAMLVEKLHWGQPALVDDFTRAAALRLIKD